MSSKQASFLRFMYNIFVNICWRVLLGWNLAYSWELNRSLGRKKKQAMIALQEMALKCLWLFVTSNLSIDFCCSFMCCSMNICYLFLWWLLMGDFLGLIFNCLLQHVTIKTSKGERVCPVQDLNCWPGALAPVRHPLSGGNLPFWCNSTPAMVGDVYDYGGACMDIKTGINRQATLYLKPKEYNLLGVY